VIAGTIFLFTPTGTSNFAFILSTFYFPLLLLLFRNVHFIPSHKIKLLLPWQFVPIPWFDS
jgi:hypothetical protein